MSNAQKRKWTNRFIKLLHKILDILGLILIILLVLNSIVKLFQW